MKFPLTVKRLIDGQWQARCMASAVGDVTVQGATREAAMERAKREIQYRIELCP